MVVSPSWRALDLRGPGGDDAVRAGHGVDRIHGDLPAGKALDEVKVHHCGLARAFHRVHHRADVEDVPREEEHDGAVARKRMRQAFRLRNRRDHRVFAELFRNGVLHGVPSRLSASFQKLDYPGARAMSSPFPVDKRAAGFYNRCSK